MLPTATQWPIAKPIVRGTNPPSTAPARDRQTAAFIAVLKGVMADARKLTFPLRDVVQIVCVVLAIATAVWAIEGKVQQLAERIQDNQHLQDERLSYMRDTIQDLKKRQELTEIELRDLKDMVVRIEAKGR